MNQSRKEKKKRFQEVEITCGKLGEIRAYFKKEVISKVRSSFDGRKVFNGCRWVWRTKQQKGHEGL